MKPIIHIQAERQRYLDDLLEEVAVVRRFWNPLGDMAVVTMLNELRLLRLVRLKRPEPN